MVGAQGKIEGDNLSMPEFLNTAVFATTYVEKASSGGDPKIGTPGTGGELSLFMGGRASDFAGFIAEAGLGGSGPKDVTSNGTAVAADTKIGTTTGGGLVGAAKFAFLFPVGDYRMGAVIHSSTGQGVAYSFETLNTGAANTHKLMGKSGPSNQHVKAFSAAEYLDTNSAATGASLVANNDSGFINFGMYEMAGNDQVGSATALTLNYLRVVKTMDVGSFDVGFGVQNFGGVSTVTNGNNSVASDGKTNAPKATIVDAQAQGEVGGREIGFYASYGTAAAGTATANNPFNNSTTDTKSALNIAAEVSVIPHTSTIQVATRFGNRAGGTDNALMVGVTYELAQNIGMSLHHTMQSGSYWDALADTTGKTATTLLLEALY